MALVRLADLALHFDDGAHLLLRAQSHGLAARVPPQAVAVLGFCASPRSRDEVEEALGPHLAGLYDGLARAGFLVPPERAADTPGFFHNFAGTEIHRRMLADRVRVGAYARALERRVGPETVVLDAGTGTGVLAALAARAGARRVHAVDNSDVLDLARQVIRDSGLDDRVRVVRGDFARVELPEPVDLIVSETFGALALAEGSVPDLAEAVRRHLAPGGRVVPDGVSLHLAPVGDPAVLHEAVGAFEGLDGLDLSALRRGALARGRVMDVPEAALLHPGGTLCRLPYPDPEAEPAGRIQVSVPGGSLVGLCGWFDVFDGEHRMFGTGPADPPTHWRQVLLPLEPVEVPAGPLRIEARLAPAPDDRRSLEVEARITLGDHTLDRRWRVR
jgi:type I protein arginine methyltransferase